LLFIVAALCPAFAQNGVIPYAIGYTQPSAFRAAPGEVATLFLYGIPFGENGRNRSAQADAGMLPTNLAGISVRVFQGNSPGIPAGIFAVQQIEQCGLSGVVTGDQSCLLTMVKLQFPFEFTGDPVLQPDGTVTFQLPALISIDVDGHLGRLFPLQPLPDDSHILTTCDASWDTNPSSVCDRQVYHSDGSVVTQDKPANVGETLFLLFYGLGRTDPAVPTGTPSPAGVAATDPIQDHPRVTLGIEPNFLNAVSSSPRAIVNTSKAYAMPVTITSRSLQSGQIGVYQVSFTVPAPSLPLLPCGNGVRSNSLLYATTSQGVESMALCIQ